MRWVFENPVEAKLIGKRAREEMVTRFSPQVVIRDHVMPQLDRIAGRLPKKKKGKKQMKKTGTSGPTDVPLAPYLPPELTKETREFFTNQPRLKALLEMVFSPVNPKDTEADRLEYEEAKAEFDALATKARVVYEEHERRANERMWRAIQQLPADLHDEAIASKPEKVPEPLLFHVRYGNEVFRGLNNEERRKLQVFHNLMYVRYPHAEEKARNPQRFWIPENQVISRQKEAAMAKLKAKKR